MIKRVKAIVSKAELRNHMRAKRNAKEETEDINMKPLEYTTAIVAAIQENDIDKMQRIRESYEWESSLKFNAEVIVAITLIRAALGYLGINNEPFADCDCNESQYAKVVLAYSKELQKSGVPHEEIRVILDKYRIGGESYNAAMSTYQSDQ